MIMSTSERHDVARAAGFCLHCMNPSYKFRLRDYSHKCGGKKNTKFKCSQPNCNLHLWVCTKHKMENADIFQKLESEIWERYQIKFAYLVRTYLTPPSPPVSSPSPETITIRSDSESDSSVVEVLIDPSVGSQSGSNASSKNIIPSSNCQHTRLDTNQALSQLRDKLKEDEISSPLKPVSSGVPQFILGYTKGKTRPLLTLYDTGCLSVLFKEGVPEKELSPAVLKCKGPIYVNGVGNTKVQVNDEYMCSVPLVDGSRAVLEGLTVNEITAAIPVTSLGNAENVLKRDDKKNTTLQSLNCYATIGGQCDILLGIQYSNLFPKPVHTLENGLTIYKLVISSHDERYNATIGGPHESFNSYANYFGSIPVCLANMQAQLENYNKFGAPKISYTLPSNEDIMFAKELKLNMDDYEDNELLHHISKEDNQEVSDATIDQVQSDDKPSSMNRDVDGAEKSL